ncbi:trypsin-like peptidase domain-containing protein [Paraflavitalea pollutisoli]|uniref:trypsin-like peptidase domain-containing protein n=1 Tax=Paraflavitalea pollutisoli TaxID=3034143 RepID=UPI0023ED128F|nr:trypsin-like peptidase domain-containing protein [Paraflavitalea sp. H1-2-19X]
MQFQLQVLAIIAFLPGALTAQLRESWITLPKDKWPVIALTNHFQFTSGTTYVAPSFPYAATGFLIDTGTDTLAATAKHVLWIAKEKSGNRVTVPQLQQWVMKPKNNHADSARIGRLINEDTTEILEGKNSTILERDWLVFSVSASSPALYPLKPRYTPVLAGEKVFVLSNAYNDSVSTIHEGIVVAKQGLDLLIQRDMATHKGGCSGSPVIDANGYLIGVISSASVYGTTGTGVSVAISTEYLRDVLDKKEGLNRPRKDYGELILATVLQHGARAAIRQYHSLIKDPGNYYIYNLRSANRNGLRETGEKLLEMKRYKDAVAILAVNVQENQGYYVNYNLLAKAYLLTGNKQSAVKAYEESARRFNGTENEAFEALKQLAPAK